MAKRSETFQIPSMMQVGRGVGMVALNDALMELVTKKIVAPDEAYAKAVDKTGFEALLKRAGLDARPRPQPAAVSPQHDPSTRAAPARAHRGRDRNSPP